MYLYNWLCKLGFAQCKRTVGAIGVVWDRLRAPQSVDRLPDPLPNPMQSYGKSGREPVQCLHRAVFLASHPILVPLIVFDHFGLSVAVCDSQWQSVTVYDIRSATCVSDAVIISTVRCSIPHPTRRSIQSCLNTYSTTVLHLSQASYLSWSITEAFQEEWKKRLHP